MSDETALKRLAITVAVLFIFTTVDFIYCMMAYREVSLHNSLALKLFFLSIPALIVAGAIYKIKNWDIRLEDIATNIFAFILLWAGIMAMLLKA